MDDLISLHEASHVVVAHAVGLPVRSVRVGYRPCFDFIDAPRVEQRVAHLLVMMAGVEGDCTPIGGGTDDAKVLELLDGENEAELRRQVRLFLADNYPVVMRVAAALRRAGVLRGDQVERLMVRSR